MTTASAPGRVSVGFPHGGEEVDLSSDKNVCDKSKTGTRILVLLP